MLAPHYFDDYSFVVQLEIRTCESPCFVLLSQDFLGSSRPFVVSHKFQRCFFYFCKTNVIGILIGIALNLQVDFDNIAILTKLILLIHEHRIPFHLLVSLISLVDVLQISEQRSFAFLVKFVSKDFVFDAILRSISLFLFQKICCQCIDTLLIFICYLFVSCNFTEIFNFFG